MLERIRNMPHSLVKKLDGVENLAVYVVEDFNLKLLNSSRDPTRSPIIAPSIFTPIVLMFSQP